MGVENVYLTILKELDEGVYFMDPNRTITFWNQGAERITGYSAAEVVGRNCRDNVLVHVNEQGVMLCDTMCPAHLAMLNGQPQSSDVYLHHKSGHRVPVRARIYPFIDENNRVVGAFEVFANKDVATVEKARLQQFIELALVDSETGLFNKRYFDIRINSILKKIEFTEEKIGFIAVYVERLFDMKKRYGAELVRHFFRMTAETIKSSLDNPNANLFFWGDGRILVLVPLSKTSIMNGYKTSIEQMVRESFMMVETARLAPTIKLAWMEMGAGSAVEEILHAIDDLFLKT